MELDTSGLDGVIKMMDKLGASTEGIYKAALYKGAEVIADEIRKNLDAIPVAERSNGDIPWVKSGQLLRGITSRQKADIIEAFGVSKHRVEGAAVVTTVGFNTTKKGYTQGYFRGRKDALPIPLLLRSIESGCSFRQKIPVIRPAVQSKETEAVKAMETEAKRIISKITGDN